MNGKMLSAVVNISGQIDPSLNKTINGVLKRLGGINLKSLAVKAGAAVSGAAIVKTAFDATKALVGLDIQYDKAVNQLSASTGATGEELQGLSDIVKDVYANGMGESLANVSEGLATVKQVSDLTGKELESATNSAFLLSDTFRYEINESTRAASALMKNFNMSAEDAYGTIALGAQNGADKNGDLLDTLNEYSTQYAALGLSGDQFIGSLVKGADAGLFSMDKVGDAVKEFNIRAKDGSKTSTDAFQSLGFNANTMFESFAAGGDEAQTAFFDTITALSNIQDPLKKNQIGVELFGTQFEDLEAGVLPVLASMKDATYDQVDALKKVNDVKYNDLGSAFEQIKRTAEVGLLPVANLITNALTDVAPLIKDALNAIIPVIQDLATTAAPFIQDFVGKLGDFLAPIIPMLMNLAKDLLPVIMQVVDALFVVLEPIIPIVLQLVQSLLPLISKLLKSLMPVIQFLANIIGSYLANALSYIMPIIENVIGYFTNIIDFITNVFTGNWSAAWENIKGIFSNAFNALVGIAKAPFNGVIAIINALLDGINQLNITIPDWVPFGLGGQTFGLDIPKIPMLATGGFTDGPSLAGEKRTEAVISFDPAYRSENLSYWAQAGQMLGANDGELGQLTSKSTSVVLDVGGVTFAPQVTVYGDADKREIIKLLKQQQAEFFDMLEEWAEEREMSLYETSRVY